MRGLRGAPGGMPFVWRAGRARQTILPFLRARAGCPASAPQPGPVRGRERVAERRVCSVLFCDVVGFTSLSESRDPEAVRELLSEYFARPGR